MTPQERFAAGDISEEKMSQMMAKRRRFVVISSTILIIVLFFLVWAFWPSGKKATLPVDAPVTASAFSRAEGTIKSAIADLTAKLGALTSKVDALEKRPVPKTGASQRAVSQLAGQVKVLTEGLGDQSRRLDAFEAADLEVAINRPLVAAPTLTPEPEEEQEELSDEQLAEQYRRAVRRGKLPDNQ